MSSKNANKISQRILKFNAKKEKRLSMKFCGTCGNDLTNMRETVCPTCSVEIVVEGKEINMKKQAVHNESLASGRVLLLIAGIIYAVFGSFGIFTASLGIITADYWDLTELIASGISWSTYYTIWLIGSIAQVFIGIMGIINRKKLNKASILRILGCIDIGLVVLSTIFSLTMLAFPISNAFFAFVLGLVLPVLYLIGASKNLKAYRNSEYTQN